MASKGPPTLMRLTILAIVGFLIGFGMTYLPGGHHVTLRRVHLPPMPMSTRCYFGLFMAILYPGFTILHSSGPKEDVSKYEE
jgi:hypothetical protein